MAWVFSALSFKCLQCCLNALFLCHSCHCVLTRISWWITYIRPTRMMSKLDFTKTQLAIFAVTLLLAVDSIKWVRNDSLYLYYCQGLFVCKQTSLLLLNSPVKIFLHVFPRVAPWHIASVCIGLMVYVRLCLFYHSYLFVHISSSHLNA